jgi:hypothetical protein
LGETFVTIAALGTAELDLDQFVVVKRAARLGDDRRGHAMLTDEEHWIERMAQTSKIFSLPFCEFHVAIVKIAPAATSCFPHPPGLKPIHSGLIKPSQAWGSSNGSRPCELLIDMVRFARPRPEGTQF